MIKLGAYMKLPLCLCDSCGKNKPTHKIYAEQKGEYQVGIRVCDDCLEEFKWKLKEEKTWNQK